MSWLLDADLVLYDWSNSSHTTAPSDVLSKPALADTYMDSAVDTTTASSLVTSEGRILPRLSFHGSLVSSWQPWNTMVPDVFARLTSAGPTRTQVVGSNLNSDFPEISNGTLDGHGSGGGEEHEGGGGGGRNGRGAVGSSSDSDRLVRRREQNRRAAVNCRRRRKERATNSLLEYQKFQCSNTELRHDVRRLIDTRNRLLQQLTSLCQRCASCAPPLPAAGTDVCQSP